MPQVGLRVVRGPDWSWEDEDGGEGYTGTLYHVDMIDKTAIVQWDNGNQTLCKIGQMDTYELRIIDNAQIGIRHEHFECDACGSDGSLSSNFAGITLSSQLEMNIEEDVHFAICDECKGNNIRGRRYKCRDCVDYDLCELCYQRDKHDVSHSFIRIDSQNCEGITLLPRQIWKKNQEPGTVHGDINCDGCNLSNIRGIRYKCRNCFNYDLCGLCYYRNKHELNHSFRAITSPNSQGLCLAPRSTVNFIQGQGLTHPGVRCDGCGISNISGIRYKCKQCVNYDLCGLCYYGNKHNLNHSFIRLDLPHLLGVYMAPRSILVKNDEETLHKGINCDGCNCRGIRGLRYKCNNCYDYDLCNLCYHGNKHDLSHSFRRIDSPNCQSIDLPPRQNFEDVNIGIASIHIGVQCDGCNIRNISGIRYKCFNCFNYDLCEICYNTKKHELSHIFKRLDLPRSVGLLLPPRSRTITESQDTVQEDIFSDEDPFTDILGMRYTCNDCDSYDLCYICYHGGKHDLHHSFRRIEAPESIEIDLPPRSYSRQCQLRGIFNGARVIQGIDWDWDNREREPGIVLDIVKFNSQDSWRSAAYVKWSKEETQLCRLGYKGHCDIKFIKAALGISQYYPEHLPVLGQSQEQMILQGFEIYEDEYNHASDTEDGTSSIAHLSLNEVKKTCSAVGSSSGSSKTKELDKPSTTEHQLKQLETKIAEMEESQTCAICLENKRDTVFLCGHGTCSTCADSLVSCHLCRKRIERKIRIY